jgi:hypothetical protein
VLLLSLELNPTYSNENFSLYFPHILSLSLFMLHFMKETLHS